MNATQHQLLEKAKKYRFVTGSSTDLAVLENQGYLEYAGRRPLEKPRYYRLTSKGHQYLRKH